MERPFKLNNKVVDTMEELREIQIREGKLEYSNAWVGQWECLMRLIGLDSSIPSAPLRQIRKNYLDYVLLHRIQYENMDMQSYKMDFFQKENSVGFSWQGEEKPELFDEVLQGMEKGFLENGREEAACELCAGNNRYIYQAVKEADIPGRKKQGLYYILTALYCRLGIPYEKCRLNRNALELLYEENGTEHTRTILEDQRFTVELSQMAGGKAYVFPVAENDSCDLPFSVKRIRRKRGDFGVEVNVDFNVGGRRWDGGRLCLGRENFYDLIVTSKGNVWRVLPHISKNGDDIVIRPGNGEERLLLFSERKIREGKQTPVYRWTEEDCKGVTAFAADGEGGFLAVADERILRNFCLQDMVYRNRMLERETRLLEKGRGIPVVDVIYEEGLFAFLRNDGTGFGDEKLFARLRERKGIPDMTLRLGDIKLEIVRDGEGYQIGK